ncbi:MAG: FHA domain-containing protein [Acidobacteriota bacterium]
MQARPARLLCQRGAAGGTRFDFTGQATLGRAPECTVVLEASEISSRHARISWDEEAGRYLLEDLGSLNGTELDGEPVSGGETLSRMHVITLGGAVEVIYQGPELVAAAPPTAPSEDSGPLGDTTDSHTVISAEPLVLPGSFDGDDTGMGTRIESQMAPLPSAFGTAPPIEHAVPEPTWRLRIPEQGPQDGFVLQPGANRVGRLPSCEIMIDGATISRLHAVLTVHRGRLRVRDDGSRNGTWLDDQRVTGDVEVSAGAALRFGEVSAIPLVDLPNDSGPTNSE